MTHADDLLPAAASSQRWEDAVLGELWAVKRRINAEAKFDPAVLHAQAQAAAAQWRAGRSGAETAAPSGSPARGRHSDPGAL